MACGNQLLAQTVEGEGGWGRRANISDENYPGFRIRPSRLALGLHRLLTVCLVELTPGSLPQLPLLSSLPLPWLGKEVPLSAHRASSITLSYD